MRQRQIICLQCGNLIDFDSFFCEHCGELDPFNLGQENKASSSLNKQPNNRIALKNFFFGALSILIFTALTTYIFYFIEDSIFNELSGFFIFGIILGPVIGILIVLTFTGNLKIGVDIPQIDSGTGIIFLILIIVAFFSVRLINKTIERIFFNDHNSISDIAHPGNDFSLTLQDGASIYIPGDSILEDIDITIERNPEKAKSLPDLGDDIVPLSDFYNFQVEGLLTDSVELTIPYNKSNVPGQDGILVAAFPSDTGWNFIPVESIGNLAIFNAYDLGDPLIAWHFAGGDRVDLSYKVKYSEPLTVCDPRIQIEAIKMDHGIAVVGQVKPIDTGFEGIKKFLSSDPKPASNIEVTLSLTSVMPGSKKGWWRYSSEHSQKTKVITDDDGFFSHIFYDYDLPSENGNTVFADAKCDEWFGTMSVISRGQKEVMPVPSDSEQDSNVYSTNVPPTQEKKSPTKQPTNPPKKTSTPIPDYPIHRADQSYNCREGPDTNFGFVAAIDEGTKHRIIGRASNGWLLLSIDYDYTSYDSCWVIGGYVTGNLSTVKYYKIEEKKLPIYDFNTFKFIGYMNCSDVNNYKWYADDCNGESAGCFNSKTPLFGKKPAGFYRHEGNSICGFGIK